MPTNKYDVVILGSGLGGLECGVILSKEGLNVCVLEQNNTIGGCLQSFRRNGTPLDTGIHYVGSMSDGQILNQFFKYFGILNSLSLKKLDDNFDVISLPDNSYNYANGYGNFYDTMSNYFPNERDGLKKYLSVIEDIGTRISIDNLKKGFITAGSDTIDSFFGISASQFIAECTTNQRLQNVLAGTSSLYGGIKNESPLYHHAMINHSNIEGAYRFAGGSQSVADLLTVEITKNGCVVRNNSKVVSINVNNDSVSSVTLESGEIVEGKTFISNIHPAVTLNMLEKTSMIKKAYITRFNSMPNSYGMFTVYLMLKKESVKYVNHNQFLFRHNDCWDTIYSDISQQPKLTLLSYQAQKDNSVYCNVASLMTPMRIDIFEKWRDTTHNKRGEDYETLKREIANKIIDFVCSKVSGLRENIKAIYTTTPLSYLEYTSTPDGSAYGLHKNCNSPLTTLIPARTKIPNLLLTGQNLNVHGAIGVTLTSAITCSNILGEEYLAKKIGNY